MKPKVYFSIFAMVVALPWNAGLAASDTAFTYQGRLTEGGNAASGTYDFRFRLASDPLGNNYVGSAVISNGVPVTSGLFTVSIDFGGAPFNGSNLWLEVDVRTNGGGGYSALFPLQPVTVAPEALYAAQAGSASVAISATTATTANSVAWSNITGIPPGFADGVDNDTQYSAGAGLTLNGTQFNVSFGGNGSAPTVAHSDHQHDALYAPLAHTHAAGDVVSGTFADVRLSLNIPRLDGNQTFSGTNMFSGTTIVTNGPNRFAGAFTGDGGGLTNLNGAVITAGSIGGGMLADGSITPAKIAPGAVGTGQISDSAVTSAKIADGTILPGDLNVGAFSTTFWQVNGNTGTSPTNGNFLGTSDNQPMELWVNGTRAFRLEPATNTSRGFSPNVIGGYQGNNIATGVIGATISGGGRFDLSEGSALAHHITAHHGTIGGGDRNTVTGEDGTVAGGGGNSVGGPYSTVGGGLFDAVISNAWYATIGGGAYNTIGTNSSSCTISGGYSQTIRENTLDGAIGGGSYNSIGANGYYSTIAGGRVNSIGDTAISSAIGGGYNNVASASYATLSGGANNSIQPSSDYSVIGGGLGSTIGTNASYSTIGGGENNAIQGSLIYATISGGDGNNIEEGSSYSLIAGGIGHQIGSPFATVGGGGYNQIGTNSNSGTISGGYAHQIANNSFDGTIGGGSFHYIGTNSYYSTIAGGRFNSIGANLTASTIAGGMNNSILATTQTNTGYSAIDGGYGNTIQTDADMSVIAGGSNNVVQTGAVGSFIGGGNDNIVGTNAIYATIPGGTNNFVGGSYSLAAGQNAVVAGDGSFVWNSYPNPTYAVGANVFSIFGHNGFSVDYNTQRPDGGGTRWVYIGNGFVGKTAIPATISTWNGAYLSDAGAWTSVSDRLRKENFTPVDARVVLEQVATMPITTWNYTNEPASTRHLGPVAQDFHEAFGLNGGDDRHIVDIDESGVALAAIQGLNQKLEDRLKEKTSRIEALEKQNAALTERLAALEQKFTLVSAPKQ